MTRRLLKFDVFRAGIIGGTPLGDYVETIVAETHRHATHIAQRTHGSGVVVMPAGRRDSAPPPPTRRTISDRRADRRPPHRHRH